MSRARPSDPTRRVAQWSALQAILEATGRRNRLHRAPSRDLPDLVFTANAALIYRQRAVLARFRHPQRQGEEPHVESLVLKRTASSVEPPAGVYFEGAGTPCFAATRCWPAIASAATPAGMQQIGEQLAVA